MSSTQLPAEIASRLALIQDKSEKKRLDSRARRMLEKDHSVEEILAKHFAHVSPEHEAPRMVEARVAVEHQAVDTKQSESVVSAVESQSSTGPEHEAPRMVEAHVAVEHQAVDAKSSDTIEVQSSTGPEHEAPRMVEARVAVEHQAVDTKQSESVVSTVESQSSTRPEHEAPRMVEAHVAVEHQAVDAKSSDTIEVQSSTGPEHEAPRILMTGTHDGGKVLPFKGSVITQSVAGEVKTRTATQAPVTPPQPAQSHNSQVTHSFRVCQPTTLDASKPAWSFAESEAKPTSEPAPLPATEPKAEVIEKEAEEVVTKDAIAWFAAHANLYTLARVLLYCAIIATSRQPVDDFFQTLNVFGAASLNSFFALAVTITMDLIAMNLFGRAIRAAFGKTQRLELTLAYGLPALAIIGANVLLTHRNIETKANVNTNAKAEAEYKAELKIAKEKQETANSEYASAEGVHFAKRWKGAPDPLACESGKAECKGPFVTGNEKEQAAYFEKRAAKAMADKAVADLEAKRPVLTDSTSAAGVDQKLWVYLVLWAGVLMSYVYEPRKNKSGMATKTAG